MCNFQVTETHKLPRWNCKSCIDGVTHSYGQTFRASLGDIFGDVADGDGSALQAGEPKSMTVPHDHGGQSRIEPPSEASWSAWSPEELAERLKGVDVLWYVVGGWALDLHAGNLRRAHDDLEFAVLPQGIRKVAAHLSDLTFFEHINGRLVPWDTDGAIREDAWQFWGADLGARKWRVDMMVERGTRRHWVYKRDASIRQERNKAIRKSVDGIPYLAPANILLFKAKHCRPKDDDDFDALLPVLSSDDRAALYSWLKSQSPSHKWLSRLR